MENIYDLIMGKGPDAQATSQAMAQAIRGKRSGQALYALGAEDVPSALSKVYGSQAAADEEMLTKGSLGRAQYGEEKRGLQQSLANMKAENDIQKALIGAGASMHGADAAADSRMFAATLAAQERGDRQRDKADAKTEGYIQKFSNDAKFLEKMSDDLAQLRNTAKKSDIPGFGPVAGYMPDWLISQEGIETRQAGGRLMNAILYMRSGKTVTEKEAERQFVAYGVQKGGTPEGFAKGVEELDKELRTEYKRVLATYPREAVDIYHSRGGGTSLRGFEQGPTIGQSAAKGGRFTHPKHPGKFFNAQGIEVP